ncbi:hypothetical protein ACIBH1_48845 [Nonomuraea sp. NPDC050663]|uniref:hypothetical protein n=1 Tax=Nonomuraea sp. NPDC050663 TaxID=3364370 RepID=UPI003798A6D3
MWNILSQAGIDPAPRRSGPTWKQFLTAQAEHIVAVDFLHVDTVNLKRIYALVLLENRSRRAHLLGVTANPTRAWTAQAARNFLMDTDTTNIKFLIRDRAGQFAEAFDTVFADAGLRVLKSPTQAEAGPPPRVDLASHRIHRRTILSGLVNEYQIAS